MFVELTMTIVSVRAAEGQSFVEYNKRPDTVRPLLFAPIHGLRQRSAEEDGTASIPAALMDKEDNVLSALQLRSHPLEVVFAVDRSAIYLKDELAFSDTDIFRKGTRLHIADDNALVRSHAQTLSKIACDGTHG